MNHLVASSGVCPQKKRIVVVPLLHDHTSPNNPYDMNAFFASVEQQAMRRLPVASGDVDSPGDTGGPLRFILWGQLQKATSCRTLTSNPIHENTLANQNVMLPHSADGMACCISL